MTIIIIIAILRHSPVVVFIRIRGRITTIIRTIIAIAIAIAIAITITITCIVVVIIAVLGRSSRERKRGPRQFRENGRQKGRVFRLVIVLALIISLGRKTFRWDSISVEDRLIKAEFYPLDSLNLSHSVINCRDLLNRARICQNRD